MRILYFIYLSINLLFLYKYGSRIFSNYIYLILLGYVLIVGIYYYNLSKYKTKINSNNSNKLYWIITFITFLSFLIINYLVDGNQINVDRWSAMDVGIKALLSGEYPYAAIDHLGGRTSNFPGLFLIGMPFYLIGDVGYLQVILFLLISVSIHYFFKTNYQRFLILGFLLLSPAYYWEIFVKSDLMSNIFLALIFLIFWKTKFHKNLFSKPILLGIIIGIMVLTRGIVYLPLAIFMFKPFITNFGKSQIKFLLSLTVTIILLILPIYLSMPEWNIVKVKNPLVLQTSYLPNYIVLGILILTVFFIFKTESIKQKLVASFILILLSTSASFIFFLKDYSWHRLIIESKFDISYFGMVLPFLLFSIGYSIKHKKSA